MGLLHCPRPCNLVTFLPRQILSLGHQSSLSCECAWQHIWTFWCIRTICSIRTIKLITALNKLCFQIESLSGMAWILTLYVSLWDITKLLVHNLWILQRLQNKHEEDWLDGLLCNFWGTQIWGSFAGQRNRVGGPILILENGQIRPKFPRGSFIWGEIPNNPFFHLTVHRIFNNNTGVSTEYWCSLSTFKLVNKTKSKK